MPLKAGVVQLSPTYGQREANLERIGTLVREGAERGARLLVLPEMAWTGYLWPDHASILPLSEVYGQGPGQARMSELAQTLSVTLVYGFPEREGSRFFNSQAIALPDGSTLPIYRKTHLFEADHWWSEPGESGYQQWPSPLGTLGSGVCMDLNFPDLVDFHALRGTDILAFSTNWLDQDFDVIPYWEMKLAGEDGLGFRGPALFANRGGEEFGVPFRGQSAVFFDGVCLASLPGVEDGVLVEEFPGFNPRKATPGAS